MAPRRAARRTRLPTGTSPTNLKPFWTGDAVKGFKYSDSKGENGPVKSALIKLASGVFQIKVAVDGKLGPVDVVPPNPGSDGCVLFTISGGRFVQRAVRERQGDEQGRRALQGREADQRRVVRAADDDDDHLVVHDDDHAAGSRTSRRPGPRPCAIAIWCSPR